MAEQLLIGGEWVPAASGQVSETFDPAGGTKLADFAEAGSADVDAAVGAARAAFEDPAWRDLSPDGRGRLLWKVADLIERDAAALAELETRDQGMPIALTTNVNVTLAAQVFRYYAGWATKIEGKLSSVSVPDTLHYTRREPLGVVGLITPWNFPFAIAAWKLAPALATGNTVVLKPAEQTPLSTLKLGALCLEAGIPAGVVNVLTGGPEAGKALVAHRGVNKISFTGSTEVGQQIAGAAAADLKRVSLELGGKAPSIITRGADIDAAVAGNLQGALFNTGQACGAYTRFYVDAERADEFTEKIAAAAQTLKIGPGLDFDTVLGPLVSQEHLDRVTGYVDGGVEQGAQLVTGGKRASGPGLDDGYFFTPTVFSGVRDDMTIAREEIFGPVLSIFSYEDEDEVVARANDTDYGLAAVLWTQDLTSAHRLAARIHAGTVFVNQLPLIDPGAPWGGFGLSGWGREMGTYALDEFTETKGVWVNLAR
ncbi:aldehyde dehydrogenase family protein [Paractinoplanes brasiliensis]|uniref:Aldehyde dehydrogenase (Acceptor) n=1 Tax=Paractinoplanes brasiliensis TaxID=52695 RepID=A0A4R6JM37_9ACTN|nr:aldehyde dehydrogenase family protein [Actinoplanes brasiliensis]TDO37380.1 aldehyde dehydrogenase (acceptor) [Actinoplanes brasiliensis]GID29304.1 putative aldehyde dehydrogenase DhaS [Actinoplanes brasiliensis]